MDVVAVQQASDSDLEMLGLTRRGDLLALRSYVEATGSSSDACEERKAKKIKLLQLAKDIKTSKKEGNSTSSILPKTTTINKEKHCSRKIQIGWLHYSSREKRYIFVRYNKGGGSREISMSLTANDKDVINKAKELFFPSGKSFHGEAIDMTFSLGRFDCTAIQDEKFSLGKYIEENKLTRVRLYLMSKHDEESDCDGLDVAAFDTDTTVPTELDATPSSSASSCDNAIDGLIGTSTERAKLKEQQNDELQRSLMEDQAKDQQKAAAIEVLKKQQRLQNARLSRVPSIPPPGVPRVLISVRHPTEGVHTRSFCQLETMSAVYDWAGSLALTPESFILSKCTGNVPDTLPPGLSVTDVDKHLLIMVEDDNMPSYPGNYIDFLGFGQDIPEEDINISWTTPPHIENIPNVLLVDDDLQM